VGFESSEVARRRLAAVALHNQQVLDAMVTPSVAYHPQSPIDTPSVFWGGTELDAAVVQYQALLGGALAGSLEVLAQDIADTPGAGGALLATFAEQVRVLRLVAEAARRAPDAPLPPSVLAAVRATIGDAEFRAPAPHAGCSATPSVQ
jgi:hypothetical protein